MSIRSLALAGSLSCLSITAAYAAVTTYSGTFRVNDTGYVTNTEISVGDVFFYQFTVNSDAVDSDPLTPYAQFNGAVTNFIFGKVSGDGTWNPSASGTWTVGADSYARWDQFSFTAQGQNLQTLSYSNGEDSESPPVFTTTTITLNPYIDLPMNDTGAGQTLGEILGDFEPSSIFMYFTLGGGDTEVFTENLTFGEGESIYAVPEASSSLLALGGVAMAVLRRRRK